MNVLFVKKKMNENKNNNRDDDDDFELELDDNDIFYNPLVYFISVYIIIYFIAFFSINHFIYFSWKNELKKIVLFCFVLFCFVLFCFVLFKIRRGYFKQMNLQCFCFGQLREWCRCRKHVSRRCVSLERVVRVGVVVPGIVDCALFPRMRAFDE
jgi:Ca2+/Na+ antiporter